MSKPSIQNITTSQTFQNWFDKTNEMVDIMRDSAVTASVSGDTTTGDATILGEFTANTIVAVDELRMDVVSAATPGNTIQYDSPVEIIGATQSVVATFNYGAQGGRTRYTDGTTAWDTGFENSTTNSFLIKQGAGDPQFLLTTAGVLTVPSLTVLSEINFPTDANGAVTGTLTAANAEISGTLTVNIVDATRINCNDIRGQFTGDIYHPDGTKIFENGGPASNIPATFTGNVNGTVSSLTNHTTDGLAEGSTNLYFTTARVRGALTAGTGVGVIVDPNNSNKTLISIGQAVNTNSNVRFNTVRATGDITAFSSVSDIAMKENINPIENALDKVMQLGGYTFNYKNKPGEEMTGVMAQEIEKVLPGIVYETVDPETGKETYAVRHGNLVGLLIEAIKELSAKVGK
jgi:hypothetical protein